MGLLKVVEDLKVVADAIDSVKSIIGAVRDGKDYVRARHPDVRSDLEKLVVELRKTVILVVEASALLTKFRFAISGTGDASELVRFNEHFMAQDEKLTKLRDQIEDLRTHCSVVREHASKVGDGAGIVGFSSIFSKLGITAPERQLELATKLDALAFEDFQVASGAKTMLACVRAALDDIQDALGPGGTMDPKNLPAAASLLGHYAGAIRPIERTATETASEIQNSIAELK
jgi:hypothetical protein